MSTWLFVGAWFPGATSKQVSDSVFKIYQYYHSHTGLEAPKHIQSWLQTSDAMSQLFKESLEAEGQTQATAEKQQIFNQMIADYDKLLSALLVWKYGFHSGGHPLGLLLHMFLHASWFHLISNMWLLWLIGFKIEDLWGKWVFLGLYFVGGIVAALAYVAITGSQSPLIGASGAIAALMGAFLLRLYKTRIKFVFVALVFLRLRIKHFSLPAYVALIFWFLREGFVVLTGQSGNVATWAHLVGFAFGVLVAFIFRITKVENYWLTEGQKYEDIKGIQDREDAEAYVGSGMFQQAKTPLMRYLKIHSEDAYAWELLARTERGLTSNYQEAAKRAIQLYLKQDMSVRAAKLLEEFAIESNLKMILHLLNHFDEPQAILEKALHKEPDSPYAPKAALLFASKYSNGNPSQLVQAVYAKTNDLEWRERLEPYL